MEPGNVIEIRGLRKSFRVHPDRGSGLFQRPVLKTVIDGIDLDIRKGETLGIIGCNGAGKTTASFTILPDIIHCKKQLGQQA